MLPPDCRQDLQKSATGVVKTSDLGLVRVTFEKFKAAHRRTMRRVSVPRLAERDGDHVCDSRGAPGRYVDDRDGNHTNTIAPTCSVCGKS
jgi:hypothetical protein